jgi:tetratricopeptide (TPR) repeat protein
MKQHGIQGELRRRCWHNFGVNRTDAIVAASGTASHILLMDADCVLRAPADFRSGLEPHVNYYVPYAGQLAYATLRIVRGDVCWRYRGVTHEYIDCEEAHDFRTLKGARIEHFADGGCRRDKFQRDIALLRQGLLEEPRNARYTFYLANSYFDIGNFEAAAELYRARITAGGFAEEVYYSHYRLGLCLHRGESLSSAALLAFLESFRAQPTRLDGLYEVVRYFISRMPCVGYAFGSLAYPSCMRFPQEDILFVDRHVHSQGFLDELAVCAYYARLQAVSRALSSRLLSRCDYERLRRNHRFFCSDAPSRCFVASSAVAGWNLALYLDEVRALCATSREQRCLGSYEGCIAVPF